jgi:hypothetical protein
MPNLTTTFTVYSWRSTVIAARTNFSILSASYQDSGTLNPDLDLDSYRLALRWLLNYTAAGIPAPSSVAEYFWSAPGQLSTDYWSIQLRQAFQSIIVYPLWLFNINNVGNVDLINHQGDFSIVPADFRTTASISAPHTKIVVNKTMFTLFLVFEVCICRSIASASTAVLVVVEFTIGAALAKSNEIVHRPYFLLDCALMAVAHPSATPRDFIIFSHRLRIQNQEPGTQRAAHSSSAFQVRTRGRRGCVHSRRAS